MEDLSLFKRKVSDLFPYLNESYFSRGCSEEFYKSICCRLIDFLNKEASDSLRGILEKRDGSTVFKDIPFRVERSYISDCNDGVNYFVLNCENMSLWQPYYDSYRDLASYLFDSFRRLAFEESGWSIGRRWGRHFSVAIRGYLFNDSYFRLFSKNEFIKMNLFPYYLSMVVYKILYRCCGNIDSYRTKKDFVNYLEFSVLSELVRSGEKEILSWLFKARDVSILGKASYGSFDELLVRLYNIYKPYFAKNSKLCIVSEENYIKVTIDGSMVCSVYNNGSKRYGSDRARGCLWNILVVISTYEFVVNSLTVYYGSDINHVVYDARLDDGSLDIIAFCSV